MEKTLVIMAAGLASRYGGGKQTASVGPNGETLMEYAIFDALKAGFEKIVIVIKPGTAETFKKLFCDRLERSAAVKPVFAFQDASGLPVSPLRSKPLGTVHAVLCAAEHISGPFAVINADDYYGPHAFAELSRSLALLAPGQASMVAYHLKNTLSPHGSVSRGICSTANGRLEKLTETYRIRLFPDGSIRDEGGEGCPLDPDCAVSMNMWGFHQSILPLMEKYFLDFLAGLSPDDNGSECLLPVMVDDMLGKNLSVSVLETEERWLGLTNRSDRDDVAAALPPLHESGLYPPKLW